MFELINVSVILKDCQNLELYLKFNKKGRIKETIFCYWSLLNEEKRNDNTNNSAINRNKVTILAEDSSTYQSALKLEINEDKHEIVPYNTEMYFVDIAKFLNENNSLEKQKEQWSKFLQPDFKELLFIGKI